MISRRISGFTRLLGAPIGWRKDDPAVAQLAVRVSDLNRLDPLRGEMLVYATAWEPTPAELAALNAGGSIILNIVGGQPPVSLHVEDLETGKEITA